MSKFARNCCEECIYRTSHAILRWIMLRLEIDSTQNAAKYVLTKLRGEGWKPAENQPGHWIRQCTECFRKDHPMPVEGREKPLVKGDILIGRVTKDLHGNEVSLYANPLGQVVGITYDSDLNVTVHGTNGKSWVFLHDENDRAIVG